MPATPLKHFDEDIARAKEICQLGLGRPAGTPRTAMLRDDLLRSSWMFCVGALDAYFCDAYADLVARTLRAKNEQHDLKLPNAIADIELPVGTIFSPTKVRENWRWRLAARGLIEKSNVLSISRIKKLLNPFLSSGNKLFEAQVIDSLIKEHLAPQRLVGISPTQFRRLRGTPLENARKSARRKLVDRIDAICQRRHDCIHNCDRPKQAPRRISEGTATKAIEDIELLVHYCDSHIESQFNRFLTNIGANGVTRSAAGY